MSDLDLKEQNHVRTAMRHLRRRIGTLRTLADALHANYATIEKVLGGRRGVSASLALRVARLADIGLDDLLDGRYAPGACPKCGYVAGSDFKDENTVVEDGPRPTCGLALVKQK
jgi:hypothetical protein